MCTKSWGQFDGSYTGNSFEGKKVLIKVKNQANIMIFILYGSRPSKGYGLYTSL
jgi:hypothetical protein